MLPYPQLACMPATLKASTLAACNAATEAHRARELTIPRQRLSGCPCGCSGPRDPECVTRRPIGPPVDYAALNGHVADPFAEDMAA